MLIFDLDGTLIDSKRDIITAVNFTLRNLNLKEKTSEEIISYIGNGVRDLLNKSLYPRNENLLEKGLAIFEDYFAEHSLDETVLHPHVEEILEYFKDKILLVVTNRTKRMSEIALRGLEIIGYFKDIIGGDDETCLKPSACPLEKAFSRFISNRQKSMIIGDMALDVLAGKNAGILTCAVTYGIGRKEDILKAEPDYIIDDIVKLKEIIK